MENKRKRLTKMEMSVTTLACDEKHMLDKLLLDWDNWSKHIQLFEICRFAAKASMFSLDYKKSDILEKSKPFKLESEFLELKGFKELMTCVKESIATQDISEVSKKRKYYKLIKLFPYLLHAIIAYRLFDLIYIANIKNPSLKFIDGLIENMVRKSRNKTLYNNEFGIPLAELFETFMNWDSQIKGIQPHDKGIGSHFKRNFTKYNKLFLKSIKRGIDLEFPSMIDRQKLILVWDIAESLNFKRLNLYLEKAGDNNEAPKGTDEYKYRQMFKKLERKK